MKKLTIILILVLCIAQLKSFAQLPGITYQAVILNPNSKPLPGVNHSNIPLSDREICLRFSFLNLAGDYEYEEIIQTKTDPFGMVNVIIGKGEQIGGSASSFDKIPWSIAAKFLEVSLDQSGSCAQFSLISKQEFTAVPFALFSVNSGGIDSEITQGKSAYQIWIDLGNVGSEQDFIKSLRGPQGPAGTQGATGTTGLAGAEGGDGLSAYQVWLGLGNTGTEANFIASLTGPAGPQGPAGADGADGVAASAATFVDLSTNQIIGGTKTFTGTVSGVTSVMVGLGDVDNTSDANKPVSTATQTALDLKAPIASPTFTGTVTVPTLVAGTNTFPTVRGSANQVLSTNGSGTLNWTTPSTTATAYSGVLPVANGGTGANSLTGIVKANGSGAMTTATAGTDYLAPSNIKPQYRVTLGSDAGISTTGGYSVSIGRNANKNWSGSYNTAVGSFALETITTGSYNQAFGAFALENRTSGSYATAIGAFALSKLTTGTFNTALGTSAGDLITTGTQNTLLGQSANPSSATAINQIVIGFNAVGAGNNTVQLGNTSITNVKTSGTITAGAITYPKAHGTNGQVLSTTGSGTLTWATASGIPYSGATAAVDLGAYDLTVNGITIGRGAGNENSNSIFGTNALESNTTGIYNVAFGNGALRYNTSGSDNVAIGSDALNGNLDGTTNTAIGNNSGVAGGSLSNTTAIGYDAKVNTSNTIQLGNTKVTSVKTSGTITAKRYELTAATAITAASTTTIDLSSGNVLTVNLGANISTLTITNAVVGTYLIKFVQDGTGSRTVTFPTTNWKWSSATVPTITTTAGKTDIVTLIFDGTTYYAAISQNF